MKHRKLVNKLNRTDAHKKAMLKNLSNSLFEHKQIKTTLIKAKFLRSYAEKIITKAGKDSVANRRYVFAKLRNKKITSDLFNEIAPFYSNRNGGYTRVLRCGYRKGDNAPLAIIQLLDYSTENDKQDQDKEVQQEDKDVIVSGD